VSDRQAPPESALYGTQMARRLVSLTLVPHGGGQQRPTLARFSNTCSLICPGGDRHDPGLGRPIAAPLERCAELVVEPAAVRKAAAKVEPYIRADGAIVRFPIPATAGLRRSRRSCEREQREKAA
jgi:hypothetical protein